MKAKSSWLNPLRLLSSLSVVLAGAAWSEPVPLEIKSSYQASTPSGQAVSAFVARANALSSGTMRLSTAGADRHEDAFLGVKSGRAALGTFEAPALSRLEAVFRLSALPMMAASFDEARTLVKVARPHYESALARHNQKLLLVKAYRPVLIWSRSPFDSTAQLSGAQVIASRREWYAPLFRMGAKETSMGAPDFVVAGPRNPSVVTYGHAIKHATQVFWALPLQFITVNADALAKLPAGVREALVAAGVEVERELWTAAEGGSKEDYSEIARSGIVVEVAPPDALISSLRKSSQADVDAWAAEVGATASEILNEYRGLVSRR